MIPLRRRCVKCGGEIYLMITLERNGEITTTEHCGCGEDAIIENVTNSLVPVDVGSYLSYLEGQRRAIVRAEEEIEKIKKMRQNFKQHII